ncbi:hypothetical protein AB0I94_34590 [Streptomyces sp. NPDC050147]|uniref:hypothetical protein n=1 Tax=Streptomyces sp. NPDC050147 TaxID=3155513 RepID=UPI003449D23C
MKLTEQIFNRLDGPADLTDGALVATYDATLTAIAGIRHATKTPDATPSLDKVGATWPALKGQDKVEGASGWICLDDNGNPWNKAMPIARLTFDRSGAKPDLLTVAWPTGEPPAGSCTPPPPS